MSNEVICDNCNEAIEFEGDFWVHTEAHWTTDDCEPNPPFGFAQHVVIDLTDLSTTVFDITSIS